VWTCSTHLKTTTMVRLDPTTGAVVESFDIDKFYDQLRLPYVDGRIWVSADGGKTLAGLRAGGDVRRLMLDKACGQVAGTERSLVVSCFIDGVVQRVDAESGKVLARADVPQPGVVAATADDVWVGSSDGLLRLDARTLRRKAVFRELSPLLFGDVRATADDVWVRLKGERFLYRIDPSTNQVAEYVKGDPNLSSGSVLVTDDAIWTTAYDNQQLFRLSR
jgi:outer membrane protein assembly factor BamB